LLGIPVIVKDPGSGPGPPEHLVLRGPKDEDGSVSERREMGRAPPSPKASAGQGTPWLYIY
jgi:hypothetical protein